MSAEDDDALLRAVLTAPDRAQLERDYWDGSLKIAGFGLIGIGMAQALLVTGHAAARVYGSMQVIDLDGPLDAQFWGLHSAMLLSNLLVVVGGANFLRMKVHLVAWAAAVLVMTPCAAPLCIVGLPFGMWLLSLLSRIPREAWQV